MQRRSGRLQARISPIMNHETSGNPEKSSRFGQRNFRLTNRIWIVLVLLVFVLSFTHFIWPSISAVPVVQNYSNADLKSKNYFNETEAGPNPFKFCPNHGPGDDLGARYGALTLSKSRMHVGTGGRVQRVINRALTGQPVTISVLGGSVSACHGAGDDPISPKCYPSKFFEWWNTIFPHPASELTNGAMRRTNSEYFGFCHSHHLPDMTDLVIIELDIEDSPGQDMMENFETLVRSILLRPDQPAVILLGHFSPQIYEAHGFAGPDHWHNIVAQFYDVPHITVKPAIYPEYMRDPKSIEKFYADPILASPAGHDLIADVLISYIQSQICAAWSIAPDAFAHTGDSGDRPGIFGGVGKRPGVPEPKKGGHAVEANAQRADTPKDAHHPLLGVPPGRINTKPNSGRPYVEVSPFCVSANDLINPLPPSLFYGSGWSSFHSSGNDRANLRTITHYWYSTLPTSKLRIPLLVGAGDIGIYFIKEPVSQVGEGSSIECWVDDNYGGAKVIENAADVGEPTPALHIIDHFVSKGSHFVECHLLGEEGQAVPAFKIMGVFST